MTADELERFPNSVTATRMVGRVTPMYERAYVAKWLYEAMGREWDKVWAVVDDLRNQMFTETVTWGIDYQEDKYSIEHNYGLTLEERRAQLYRKKNRRHGVAPGWLENYFKEAWGITVELDETYGQGVFLIEVLDDPNRHIWDMVGDLYEMKPSHLSYRLLYLIKSEGTAEYHGTVTHYEPTTWVPQPQEVADIKVPDKTIHAVGWVSRCKYIHIEGHFEGV